VLQCDAACALCCRCMVRQYVVLCCSVLQCVAALEFPQKGVFHTQEVSNSDPFPGPDLEFFEYGVATSSTLLKIIGLFCKRAL